MSDRMRIAIYFCIAVFISLNLGCSSNLVNEGNKALENGDCSVAANLFSTHLDVHPGDVRTMQRLGGALRCSGNLDSSVTVLTRALETDSANGATVIELGLSIEESGLYEDAESLYVAYLEKYPDNPRSTEIQGRLVFARSARIRQEVSEALQNEESLIALADETPRVGVLPFTFDDSSPDSLKPLGKGLSAAIMYDLSLLGEIQVVERLRLNYVIQELKLVESGLIDTTQSARLGRIAGASHLIEGVLSYSDEIIALRSALVDVRESSFKPAFGAQDRIQKIMKIQKELTFAIIDSLEISITPEERNTIEEIKAESFEAFMAYSFGIDELDRGNYEAANHQFERAGSLDPGYKPASALKAKIVAAAAAGPHSGGPRNAPNTQNGHGPRPNQPQPPPPPPPPPPDNGFTTNIFDITEPTTDPRSDDDPTVETGAIWLSGYIR